MRAVIQRVSSAAVSIDDHAIARIDRGLLVFVGVERGDGPADVQYVAGKIRDLRIFEDPAASERRVNVSVQDQAFGAALQRSFLRDFADCHEVDLRTFRFRPLSERVLEAIFYRLRKFL